MARPADDHAHPLGSVRNCTGLPSKLVFVAGSRRISCATLMPLRCPAKEFRSS